MTLWLTLAAAILGVIVGTVLMACCIAARHGDDQQERIARDRQLHVILYPALRDARAGLALYPDAAGYAFVAEIQFTRAMCEALREVCGLEEEG